MKTKEPKKGKTFRELYDQFCKSYSIDTVGNSIPLSMLSNYLWLKTKKMNGEYSELPPFHMRKLIRTHLGYEFLPSIKKESHVLS